MNQISKSGKNKRQITAMQMPLVFLALWSWRLNRAMFQTQQLLFGARGKTSTDQIRTLSDKLWPGMDAAARHE